MKPRGMMVIHQFRPITNGAELQAERLAIRLAQRGHEMQVFTELRVPGSLPEEEIQGVKVHRVDFKMAYQILAGAENTFQYLAKTRKNYDILHVHQAFGHAVVSIVAAKVFKKRSIVKVACAGSYGDLNVFSSFPGFKWALSILKQADCIIAISSDVEKELLEWGFSSQRIKCIPNGVDTQFFKREQPFPARDPLRFILIGRRTPQKGIDLALQAAKILMTEGLSNDFEIKFYGSDYPEYDYRLMAKELGVTSLVEFLPHQDAIRDILHGAHSMILPSRGEGMPNVILEGMSFELPVIASRVSGVVDIIEDSVDGLLIPCDDPHALAHAMRTIIMDPELATRLGCQARQKAISEFSLESIAERYSELYTQIYGNK
ncbi:MAG TPA: glycosyltransferase family 4 protein [Anaerolineales bacterium]|nr:glycosyltransferase family 4 protein [Anaerolineales bacterium]